MWRLPAPLLALAALARGNFLESLQGLGSAAEGAGAALVRKVPAIAETLKEGGERAAVGAALRASGRCPELWAALPGAPDYLAGELARRLQRRGTDPSRGRGACREAVEAAVADMVDERLHGHPREEKAAAMVAVDEAKAGKKICTDDLVDVLSSMEASRSDHKEQYVEAIRAALEQRVLTPQALEEELGGLCGARPPPVERLFLSGGAPAASAGSGAAALCAGAGTALAAAAASAAVSARSRRAWAAPLAAASAASGAAPAGAAWEAERCPAAAAE